MSKSRRVLDYRTPQAEASPRATPRWLLIAAAAILAIGTVGYYSYFAPQLPVSLLYRLLTDGIILLLWLAAATLGGWAVLRLFHVERFPLGLRIVTATALGLGIISLATLGLGLAGWLNRWSSIALLAILALPGALLIIKHRKGEHATSPPLPLSLSPTLLLIPLLLTALIGGLVYPGFLWGADDPAGYDVVEYHLQVPREWYEAGQIVPLHHNVFSFFPFNVEMHYLLAMHLRGGPWEGMYLAQWMHLAYIVLAVAGIGAAAEKGRPRALAILAAGSCAWLTMLGAVAYNEGGLLLYGTLAIAWMLHVARATRPWEDSSEPTHGRVARATFAPAALAGVMAGLASGCKLTGVPMLVVGIPVAMLLGIPRLGRSLALPLAAFVLAALVTLSPWLIRNQVWAGNPVFPEAMTLLGKGHFTDAQVERWDAAHHPAVDQQLPGPRVAALGEQVVFDWRYGFVLWPLALWAFCQNYKDRQALFLVVLLLELLAFWFFFTHLQSRFFVFAVPVAAFLISRARGQAIHYLVVSLLILVCALSMRGTAMRAQAMVGTIGVHPDDVMQMAAEQCSGGYELPAQWSKAPSVRLIGEAKAFWFVIPGSRLRYRTVFDVPGDQQQYIELAWMEGWPPLKEGIALWNKSELERFARTYRRLGTTADPFLIRLPSVTHQPTTAP